MKSFAKNTLSFLALAITLFASSAHAAEPIDQTIEDLKTQINYEEYAKALAQEAHTQNEFCDLGNVILGKKETQNDNKARLVVLEAQRVCQSNMSKEALMDELHTVVMRLLDVSAASSSEQITSERLNRLSKAALNYKSAVRSAYNWSFVVPQ